MSNPSKFAGLESCKYSRHFKLPQRNRRLTYKRLNNAAHIWARRHSLFGNTQIMSTDNGEVVAVWMTRK